MTDEFLRVQQFAEQALTELAQRAEQDGMDAVVLHSAFCVASAAWLGNRLGAEKARALLDGLAQSLSDGAPPTH